MSELKPCPFCGGEADEYEGDYGNGIYCMMCGAMVGEPIHLEYRTTERVSIDEAIAAWNSRAERTCRIEERNGDWYCDACGEMVGTCDTASELHIDGNAVELWRYCPNCGAKVIEEEE